MCLHYFKFCLGWWWSSSLVLSWCLRNWLSFQPVFCGRCCLDHCVFLDTLLFAIVDDISSLIDGRLLVPLFFLEPCFLWCSLLNLPIGRPHAPEELLWQPNGIHSADVAKAMQFTFLDLFYWWLIAPYPESLITMTIMKRGTQDLFCWVHAFIIQWDFLSPELCWPSHLLNYYLAVISLSSLWLCHKSMSPSLWHPVFSWCFCFDCSFSSMAVLMHSHGSWGSFLLNMANVMNPDKWTFARKSIILHRSGYQTCFTQRAEFMNPAEGWKWCHKAGQTRNKHLFPSGT